VVMNATRKTMSVAETASLVALLTSLVAISIDAMLPALPEIGRNFNVVEKNNTQLVIGLFLLGNTFGQLLFGPLSDAFGRKPVVVAALILFIAGCVLSVTADSFIILLVGRILQGVGASGPRTVSVSMVRDLYSGREMARIMSIAMTIFMIVPTIAPAIGQAIIFFAGWRYIFGVFIGAGLLGLVWVLIRQPETLAEKNRRPLNLSNIIAGFIAVVRTRLALGYALAMGTMFGSFVGFLSSIQQIFHDTFGVGKWFPYLFAVMALFTGAALIYNTRIVMKVGMQKIVKMAMGSGVVISLFYLVLCISGQGFGLLGFMVWGALSFFCIGMCFGNLNTLAMEPLGEMAGIGAAVVGFLASLVAILGGIPLGQAYDGTQLPLISGFAVLGIVGFGLTLWAGRGPSKSL